MDWVHSWLEPIEELMFRVIINTIWQNIMLQID